MEEQEISTAERSHWIVPLVLCLVVGVYFSQIMFRGWIPHDEGLLGQTAERVLNGELPHRDFDDVYTGGLSILHAAAFWLGGTRLTTTRVVLFVFAIAFTFVLYRIAARASPPWVAALVTALGVSWSVPNYFAALPSWYLLFLATFAVSALLRFLESERSVWLVVAGLMGGVGLTLKIVALYYIAAALLLLLYRECCRPQTHPSEAAPRRRGFLWFTILVSLAFCGSLLVLLQRGFGFMAAVFWWFPCVAVCAVIVQQEQRRDSRDAFADRFLALLRTLLPFLGGVALPLGLFLIPYLATGSLGDLVHGVLVLPRERLEEATYALPPASALLWSLPLVGLLLLGCFRLPRVEKTLLPLVIIPCTLALFWVDARFGDDRQPFYLAIWHSAYCALPGIVAVAAGWLALQDKQGASLLRRQQLFLLLATASLLNLVQFPYSFGVYFFYVAPMVVLLVHFLAASQPQPPRWLYLCAATFYLCFALVWLNSGFTRLVGVSYLHLPQASLLDVPRGGLWMLKQDVRRYQPVIELVQRHSADGSSIYAAPDCPEIYFLTERKNPTRTMYDFFDRAAGRSERILELLDAERVGVVVVNLMPEFSARMSPELLSAIRTRFPEQTRIKNFLVLWRKLPAATTPRAPAGGRDRLFDPLADREVFEEIYST